MGKIARNVIWINLSVKNVYLVKIEVIKLVDASKVIMIMKILQEIVLGVIGLAKNGMIYIIKYIFLTLF